MNCPDPITVPPEHIIIVEAVYKTRLESIMVGFLIGDLPIILVPSSGPLDAPATHYALAGSFYECQRLDLVGALWLPENADILEDIYWLQRINTGPDRNMVEASHDGLRIGEKWTFSHCLAELSLAIQELPEED